jgi:DNA-binding transcriptional MerR regulator
MKIGEVARLLGKDRTTIHHWTNREEIHRFLSSTARSENGAHRLFTQQDLDVLNTVRYLRDVSSMEWEAISGVLKEGTRIRDYPQTGFDADTRVISVQRAEQAAELMAVRAELERATAELEKLNEQRQQDSLKINELYRQIGKLEGFLLTNGIDPKTGKPTS